MKFFLLMFLASSAFADCHLFALKGLVRPEKSEITLIVNQGTASEKKYPALRSVETAFAPYHDQFVSGEFVLGTRDPLTGSKLLAISKLEHAVPDPLHHTDSFSYKKKVPCPK